MIPRRAADHVLELVRGFPIVSITGPRQSGKTTLARASFPDRPYANLESPAERAMATADPLGFLGRFPDGAVLDEIQHCPDLFSFLQVRVDEDARMGRFIITGSQQFGLNARISQSLAGRVGAVTLLPFALAELAAAGRRPGTLDQTLWNGFYPPIYDRDLAPPLWFDNYLRTYLERDVRQLSAVQDLSLFQRFLRLCAGRTAQLLNMTALASDAGVSPGTVRNWLSLLEASYVIKLLPPYHRNYNKRLVKTPKLFFLDVGLAAALIGITDAVQIATHPLRGPLFETLVFGELLKARLDQGRRADIAFWRDHRGQEVDFLLEDGNRLLAVEVKAAATVTPASVEGLRRFTDIAAGNEVRPVLVHGGDLESEVRGCRVIGWKRLDRLLAP